MAGVSNYLASSILNTYFRNAGATTTVIQPAHFLALHVDDPTDLGLPGTEVSGGTYLRKSITWAVPTNKQTTNTNQVIFQGLPASTVTYWGLWDSLAVGHMIFSIPLVTPITVSDGGIIIVPVSDIGIQFD